MDVFSLVATLELNASNFFSGLAGAAKAMIDFAADAVKTGAEFDYTMSGVRAVMGEFDGDINELINLADEMGLSYVRGASDAETAFNILREKALASSKQTRYTAEETAEALHYMGMAGWEQVEAMQALDAVMQLAAAGNESVGRTSDIVTDALTAFKQPASEAGHLVDVMATAAAKSNTNIGMLGESFKYAAPLAGALSYSFEDMGLFLGILADNGIKAGRAGRAFNNIFTRVADAPGELNQQLQDYGISLSDSEGKLYSLRDILGQIRSEMGDLKGTEPDMGGFTKWLDDIKAIDQFELGEDFWTSFIDDISSGVMTPIEGLDRLLDVMGDTLNDDLIEDYVNHANTLVKGGYEKVIAFSKLLGGRQALPALLALINASEEEFNALADALDNSAGAGQRMQETMLDNLTGDLYKFNSAADVMRVAISDKLTPTVREFVQFGTQGINDITEAFETGGVQALPAAVARFMYGARDLIEQHAPEIQAAGQSIATALSEGIDIAWPYFEQIVGTLWDHLKPMFIEGATELMNAAVDALLSNFTVPLRGLANELRGNLLFGGVANFIDMLVGREGNYAKIVNERGETKITGSYNMGASNVGRVIGSDAVDAYEAATEAAETYNETAAEVPEEITTIVNADTSGAIANINALNNAYSSLPTSINIDIGGAGRVLNNSRSEHMNASSMSGGTILRGATMFGWDREGIPQIGGGEGAEAVVGVNSLNQMIHESVTGAFSSLMNGLGGMISGSQRQPAQLVLDTGVLVAAIAPSMNDEMSRIDTWRHGGDR